MMPLTDAQLRACAENTTAASGLRCSIVNYNDCVRGWPCQAETRIVGGTLEITSFCNRPCSFAEQAAKLEVELHRIKHYHTLIEAAKGAKPMMFRPIPPLVAFEVQILHEIARLRPVENAWGAAISAALGVLLGHGLINGRGRVTPRGWAAAVFYLPAK